MFERGFIRTFILESFEYTQLRTELVVPVITDCNLHFSFLFSKIRTA